MCGLVGIVGPADQSRFDSIRTMTRALAHRGPDDSGTWTETFDLAGSAYRLAMGHTRLSILDTSAHGHQPMVDPDRRGAIAYNGEIYNFREIRADLQNEGIHFESDCDTEVVLQALLRWGTEAIGRFVGMFAFAFWDSRHSRLVMARDRLGIKPLYYSLRQGLLLFGSELSALRAHPSFSPEIHPAALETYLRFGYTSGSQSIYRDTYRLLPGQLAIWQAGDLSDEPYWSLSELHPADQPMTFETAVDHLEGLLLESVSMRLVADVPLGAFLSGGVDSSTVVALMKEIRPQGVRTFSIGFEDDRFNEAQHARAIADHLGTEHTELYVDSSDALIVARELPALYDEPFADSSAIPTVLLSRMTRKNVTVALSGDGGDELFGGYDRYWKLARLLPLMRIPHPVRSVLHHMARILPFTAIANGLQKIEAAHSDVELAESFLSGFNEDLLARACRRGAPRPISRFSEVFQTAPGGSPLRKTMYGEAATFLCDDVLTKVDRASMSIGLEARVPILDHRVVGFAFSLPLSILHHQGVTKAPLRAVLYRRVPRELIERPKQGFGFPVRGLLGAEIDRWTKRYLDPRRIAEEGLLDPAAVAEMTSRGAHRGPQPEAEIWRLICFERWLAHTHRGECAE
jgi:asparagine synthase (glutamine-hydrolysing)